jgi:hypothetical protein
MIKEALEYLVKLGNLEVYYENGQVLSNQKLHVVESPLAESLEVRSLSGLVDYLKSGFDIVDTVVVHVKSPTEVVVFDSLNDDMNRNYYIKANAMIPDFPFGRWLDSENFIIKLQSCFVKNNDRDIMLKVVGNIKEENVNTFGDDGVSQSVVAKTGVATVADVVVPNPVNLKPYRTFVEVEQPESEFIFRMQNGPQCALFEADGGAWKLEAMRNIKNYLAEALKEEIELKNITIIA